MDVGSAQAIAIKAVVSIEEAAFTELLDQLANVPPTSILEFHSQLEPYFGNDSELVAEFVLKSRGAVCAEDAPDGLLYLELVDQIRRHLDDDGEEWLEPAVDRLQRLCSAPSVSRLEKAARLSLDNGRNYRRSSSTTDVRFVFSDRKHGEPTLAGAAIVLTTVTLTIASDTALQTLRFTCDEQDLRELAAEIERAVNKTETVKSAIESGGETQVIHPLRYEE